LPLAEDRTLSPNRDASEAFCVASDTIESTVPWAVPKTDSLAELAFSTTFLPARATLAGITLVLKSSEVSTDRTFHSPTSFKRINSLAASSAIAIPLASISSAEDSALSRLG